MWRKAANAILWVSIIASVLGVLIGSVLFFNNENYGGGFAILFGGAVMVLISHVMFGMLIELCDNVAALRVKDGACEAEIPVVKEEWMCSNCGNVNEREMVFCTNCGCRNIQAEEMQ